MPAAPTPGVRAILRSARVQAKLRVGAVDDPAEREADRVADRVMRMPEPAVATASAPIGVQRLCAECKEDVQRQPMQEEEELLQTKEVAGRTPVVTPGIAADIAAMRGGGQPLPASERAFFEPRFGRDFSQVRIHTDAQAAGAARAVHARAFTLGRNLVFDAGQYAPATLTGRQLLAHELTHVVQQSLGNSGGMIQRKASLAGWSFRASSGDQISPDNCCRNKYRQLGPNSGFYQARSGMYPSLQNTVTNGMELKAVIGGHEPGVSYDIKRVMERNSWQRDNATDPWVAVPKQSIAPGTSDDPDNDDECLTPVPQPALGSAFVAVYSTDHPGLNPDTLSATAIQGIYTASFTESVEITDSQGMTVDPLKYDWHSTTWLDKNANGTWDFNASHSEIGAGSVTVTPPPP